MKPVFSRLSPRSRAPVRLALPLLLALLLVLLFLVVLASAQLVQQRFATEAGCADCFFRETLDSGLWLLALCACLAAMALGFRAVWVRSLATGAMLCVLMLTLADLVLYSSLALRLQFSDVFKFGQELSAIGGFVQLRFGSLWLAAAVAGFLVLIAGLWVIVRSSPWFRVTPAIFVALALVFAGFAWAGLGQPLQHVHQETTRNWLALNLNQGVAQPYSAAFSAATRARLDKPVQVCQQTRGAPSPEIVLVVVESLSAYHSRLHGGHDWTPELDKIAQANGWFSQFHANGFTTDQGLIALFTGRVPLPSVGRYGSTQAYAGFGGAQGTLPTQLHHGGYETLFFTTGDLGFLDKGAWLRGIGFDHVEGAEHPFYDPHPRIHFNAAADAVLFDRFLDWRDQRNSRTPYFAALLTVSSHPPFVTPDRLSQREEDVFRYVDQQLGRFYAALTQRGFFQRGGVLLITGDHRAMTAVSASERASHGERALSRVPLVVAGGPQGPWPKGRLDSLAQQTDLGYAVQASALATACAPQGAGMLLAPAAPLEPDFVAHVRGDNRSWINIYTPRGDGVIGLDGDHTRWVSGHLDQQQIIDRVNDQRLRLGVATQDFVDYMLQIRQGARAF